MKPKTHFRRIFNSEYECLNEDLTCEKSGEKYITKCNEGFKPLTDSLCTFDCPDEFIDSPAACVPPRMENNVFFHHKFEKIETDLAADE